MIIREYILPRKINFKKKRATADEERLRFSNSESAQRYLRKFSTLEKILASLLLHPKTNRYNAAVIVSKMPKEKLDHLRNTNFYYNLYDGDASNVGLRLINGRL